MFKPKLLRVGYRVLLPLLNARLTVVAPLSSKYLRFFAEWRRFRRMGGNACPEEFKLCLHDNTSQSQTGGHPYFFQDVWALQRLSASKPLQHHDIGSRLDGFVGQATSLCPVVYWDIRPPTFNLPNLEYRQGSILDMPLADRSISSLSCLHTIEHIGLGRYGDLLDPLGTEKALRELGRILAPVGRLILSCPIGRERVCFNAHRVLHPERPIQLLPDLSLLEFSVVGDPENGRYPFYRNAVPKDFGNADEALGLFIFTRTA